MRAIGCVVLVVLALAACDHRPPVRVEAEGGTGGVDWRVGLPF